MKKLLFILCFAFSFLGGYSQYTNLVTPGGDNTLSSFKGGLKGRLINTTYSDTSAANATAIDFYAGAQIVTADNEFWVRNQTATAWIPISNSSNASITNIYNNSIVTYVLLNGDSCVVPTTGAGLAIDTICFNFVICSVRFLTDSTFLACPCDTTSALCDTGTFNPTPLYIFQNGITQTAPGVVEWGGSLSHRTEITQGGYDVVFTQANTGAFFIHNTGTFKPADLLLTDDNGGGVWIKSNGDIISQSSAANDIKLRGFGITPIINLASKYYGGIEINPQGDGNSYLLAKTLTKDSMFYVDAANDRIRMDVGASAGTSDSALVVDPITKTVTMKEIAGGGGGFATADNGLSANTATNVQLGGSALLGNTSILTSAFYLDITSSNTTQTFKAVNSSSGIGVFGTSTSGVAGQFNVSGGSSAALQGYTSGTGVGLNITAEPASTNTTITVMNVNRGTSGSASNDIGGSIDFGVTSTTTTYALSNQLISKWTDATHATRTSQFIITGVNSAVTADLFTLSGNGATRLNKYGIGTFTGTPAYTLQVDANGNIIEGAASGGTVTDFIFTDANGFDGTVSTSTTTPTLSLTTTVSDAQLFYSTSGALTGDANITRTGSGTINVTTSVTSAAFLTTAVALGGGSAQFRATSTQGILLRSTSSDIAFYSGSSNPAWAIAGSNLATESSRMVTWNSTANGAFGGGADVGIGRNAAGVLEANSGVLGTLRDMRVRTLFAGTAGSVIGTISIAGNSSGVISILPQAAAGTFNFNLPTTAGTSGYLLTSGGGGATAMTWTDPATLGGLTADNGLTENVANNVQLGGTLTGATSIATGANTLTISTATATVNPLSITATTGDGVVSVVTTGRAFFGTVSGSNAAAEFIKISAATASIIPIANIFAQSSGTAAAGFGPSLDAYSEASDNSNPQAGSIKWRNTDATAATFTTAMDLYVQSSNVITKRLTLEGDGRLYGTGLHNSAGAVTGTTNQYIASGTFTSTVSASTNTDAGVTVTEGQWIRTGNVVTYSFSFTADPTLTATATSFEFTLPVASNIAQIYNLMGTAFCGAIAAQGAAVNGVVANDTGKVFWVSGDVTSQSWSVTVTYVIL